MSSALVFIYLFRVLGSYEDYNQTVTLFHNFERKIDSLTVVTYLLFSTDFLLKTVVVFTPKGGVFSFFLVLLPAFRSQN